MDDGQQYELEADVTSLDEGQHLKSLGQVSERIIPVTARGFVQPDAGQQYELAPLA